LQVRFLRLAYIDEERLKMAILTEKQVEKEILAGIEAGTKLFTLDLLKYLKPTKGQLSPIQFESVIASFANNYFQFIKDTQGEEDYLHAKQRLSEIIAGHELE